MVDPNPARGMPIQLQRYWLVGKGAAKIRWHLPHDFNRCVRQLRKYFPKNPEGLCNILHQKALGAPPGKGHALTAAAAVLRSDMMDEKPSKQAQELLDKQPKLGQYTWAGAMAPIGRPTSEPRRTRIFEPGSLSHRTLPMPLAWRERSSAGHEGAVTVGRILGVTYGPDHRGRDYAWSWGDFLDENIIPDAKKARYLADMGVLGQSVDPGGRVVGTMDPETGYEHMARFGIGGATLVPIPAFSEMAIYTFDGDGDWPDDDEDMALDFDDGDCGCGHGDHKVKKILGPKPAVVAESHEYAVNPRGWKGLPLAPRDFEFDNDDAVKRITAWAAGDVDKMRKAFMWWDPRLGPTDPTSYRLPVGDIVNNQLTLIYHAIYAAAALISGAHGGLPNVPNEDISQLRNTISDIYAVMSKEFNDSSVRAPWDRSAQEGVQLAMDDYNTDVQEPYGDVRYADPGYRDNKKRYPIDTPDHVRAAWAYINVPKNAAFYKPEQLELIKNRIRAAAKKLGIQIAEGASVSEKEDAYSISSTGYPLTPPKAWFEDPQLTGKTRLTVTDEGRVYGHLAAWNECHRDVAMRECVLAPHSEQEYAAFHLGSVLTSDGDEVAVGKIVMDTRHASINLGYTAAALHYDNTGDEIAVIRCGEDTYGIWFAGSIVPEATPQKVAKLRRSPLSGDWRRERGSLELTAALAVNAPAFPVYSMDGEEQLALVAAGSVWFDDYMDQEYWTPPSSSSPSSPPTGIVEMAVDDEDNKRAERLRDILEDEEIYAQRRRAERLSDVLAS
jgi:hypothetical protein